ncbi:lipase secretion chaperone [Marinobacter zhejiangensis]|uniref:Lipase chaperone n=1 Tax=Marinobacter zhejiangensis TaxID=488535 RepID=A0A1I4MAR0_9GAMM|nr:lipase secretion chaperone [Marinobacter zhejiangensis]SFM00155.1 lipase chaperone protein [Marinobacter zhejiangensis]
MRYLLTGLLAVVAGLAVVWAVMGRDADPQPPVAATESRLASPSPDAATPAAVAATGGPVVSAANGDDEREASQQARRAQDQAYWAERLQGYQDHGGNLQQFFRELLAQCGGEPDLCEALLDDRLEGYPDAGFAAQLRTILQQQFQYQAQMQSLTMPTSQPPEQRYQQLDALRVQHFGDAATELLYGQERAWASYQFGYGELLEQAPYLTAEQRLQRLEQLRSDRWGGYGEALADQEGVYGRYRRERELLQAGVTDAKEREAISEALRSQYFDDEQSALIGERERVREEQAQQQQDYATAKQAFDDEMTALRGSMADAQWQQLYQQRLSELRRRFFD